MAHFMGFQDWYKTQTKVIHQHQQDSLTFHVSLPAFLMEIRGVWPYVLLRVLVANLAS